jgi:1,4-dihydroxy-2-naphthoate octaprenyltransferase
MIFSTIKNWLIFGNIWVATNATALCLLIELHLFKKASPISLFVFLGTFSSYNLIRLLRLKRIRSPHKTLLKEWFLKHQIALWLLSILAVCAAIFIALDFSLTLWIYSGVAFGLSAAYIIPLFNGKSFRELPLIKLFIIGLIWAFTSVLLPAEFYHQNLSNATLLLAFCIGLFVMAITIPFDIRDIQSDNKNMKTIPQLFGIFLSKCIALGFLTLSFVLLYRCNIDINLTISSGVCFGISSVLIGYSSPKKTFNFFAFWVEAMPITWLLAYLILEYFIR